MELLKKIQKAKGKAADAAKNIARAKEQAKFREEVIERIIEAQLPPQMRIPKNTRLPEKYYPQIDQAMERIIARKKRENFGKDPRFVRKGPVKKRGSGA
jgi:hypothetical protein